MTWINNSNKLPVPKIICSEKENETNYILMSKIKGQMLCDEQILDYPVQLMKLMAAGLRMLWDADTSDCPYINDIDNKLRIAEYNIENNLVNVDDCEPTTYGSNGFKNSVHLLQWLKGIKPTTRVLIH